MSFVFIVFCKHGCLHSTPTVHTGLGVAVSVGDEASKVIFVSKGWLVLFFFFLITELLTHSGGMFCR